MPRAGELKQVPWHGASPARISFAERFSALLEALPDKKQGARARRIRVPVSTLSCYRMARRVPDEPRLIRIFEAVEQVVPAGSLQVTLKELRDLRAAAVIPRQRAAEECAEIPCATQLRPGTGKGPARDRLIKDKQVLRALEALSAQHKAGRRRDVLNLTWSAARTLTPAQLAELALALHSQAKAELVEALLIGGWKQEQEEAMRLALALMGVGLSDYAAMVMRAALPVSRVS